MISNNDFDSKLKGISEYMLIVYKEVNQNNSEIDSKSNNMIVLLGIMIILQSTIIFSSSISFNNIIILLSVLFYLIALVLFIYSYYLKKFNVAPNNNQLIDYGKDDAVSSEQMF
ncbi:MAG: hypothetical protein LBU40_06770, partial [Methanobrevibacter sp.]|nr:hypothetical protein [Methanobrevibacter sp.]